jgi:hypothetical protein
MNSFPRSLSRGLVAAGVAGVAALASLGAQAQAVTLPDATSQLTAISTSVGGYATVMFLIAITAVGIMVGVKWIKRGKGAA